MSNIEQVRKQLMEFGSRYQSGCIIGAAAELNLFEPILHASLTAKEIVTTLKTDLRASTMLLDALAALEILDKSADSPESRYTVRKGCQQLLDDNHPETYLPMIRHQMNCVRRWTQLARIGKFGTLPPEQESLRGAAEDFKAFILAMNSVGIIWAGPMVQKMQDAGLLHFKHLLDVGGASGTYTLAFLRANPEAKATLFDVPPAIEEAGKRFHGTEFENRVSLVPGNFYDDPLPSGADFAWISAIIHQFDRSRAVELYRKVEKALVPGGIVAVRDHVLNVDRTSPLEGVLFSINMLAGTEHGMCYTFEEIKEDLETAGFHRVRLAIPAKDMSAVVVAEKTDIP